MKARRWFFCVGFALLTRVSAVAADRTAIRCDDLLAGTAATTLESQLVRELRGASPAVLKQRLDALLAASPGENLDPDYLRGLMATLQRLETIRPLSPTELFVPPSLRLENGSMRLGEGKAWFVAEGVLMEWIFNTEELRCLTSPAQQTQQAHAVAGFPLLVGADGHFLLQSDGSASVPLPDYGLAIEAADIRALATNPRQVLLATDTEVVALNHLTQVLEHPFDGPQPKLSVMDTFGVRWVFGLDADGNLWRGDLESRQWTQEPTRRPIRDLAVSNGKLLLLTDHLEARDPETLAQRGESTLAVYSGASAFDAYNGSVLVRGERGLRVKTLDRKFIGRSTHDADESIALAGRLLVRSGHQMKVGFLSKIFWAYHTQQHTDGRNKVLHYVMNAQLLTFLGLGFATGGWGWFALAPTAYLVGWAGHLLYEPNDPATWKYPLGSFATEFVLWSHIFRGTRGREERRYDAVAPMRRGPSGKH